MPARHESRHESRRRVVLAAVIFAVLLAQVLLYPGIDVLVEALGARDRLGASMTFLAAEFAAFVVFATPWGAASDAAGSRKPFIVAAAVGGAAGYVALAIAGQTGAVAFPGIVLIRALQGGATIGVLSLAMTMLMDLPGGHGRNMGAAGIAIGLGTALGAPLGGQLYSVGPLVPLYVAAGLMALCGLATTFVDEAPPSGETEGLLDVIAGLRRTPTLSLPYAFGLLDRLSAGFFALVGTLYFRDVHNLDPAATGITLGFFFAPFALLQYPFGRLSDRIGRAGPIVAGSALYGVAVLVVGLAPTVPTAQGAMVLVGVLGALMAPATMALVTDLAGAKERGVAMAGFNIAGSLGFLVGIVLGGTVADSFGYLAAFAVVGGLEVALALVTVPAFLSLETDRRASFTRQ